MASKPKSKTFIVLHNGNFGQPTTLARYRVGARNSGEAEVLLKGKIGKHMKVKMYYEEKDPIKQLAQGEIVLESSKK